KDLQEDKEGLFDAVDTLFMLLRVLPPMLETLTMKPERMAEAAIGGFSLATDVADELARRGVPFREAHEVVGSLVARCIAEGRTLKSLQPEEWAEVHSVLSESPPPVTLQASVAARDIPGGTAPNQVARATETARQRIAEWGTILADWREQDASVTRLLSSVSSPS